MLTAQVETMGQCLGEMQGLLPAHYDEISEHGLRGIPLDPNYAMYRQRENNGELLIVTLRESGTLVGYHVSVIAPGAHYQSCLTSITDIFFVYPDKRGMAGGALLFQEWERECRRRGVKLMSVGLKVKHAKHAQALFEAFGFFMAEITFWKFLES